MAERRVRIQQQTSSSGPPSAPVSTKRGRAQQTGHTSGLHSTQHTYTAQRRFTHSRRLPRTCPTRPPVHKGEDPPLSLLCQSRGRMTHAGSVRFPVIGREPIQSPVY
ncbi:hypothetical protein NQZ68_021798 [Dissostichus eleginoides]|nr:hypothetical protein NQZ68_021798 [Dissostichus eleginoides]